MPQSVLMGTLIDTEDNSSIEFHLPTKQTGSIEINTETYPNWMRNASVVWWDGSVEKVPIEATFIYMVDADLEVLDPLLWLKRRCYPKYLGDKIASPPPKLLFVATNLTDPEALWNIIGPLSWEAEGNPASNPHNIPPKLTIRFTLERADDGAGRPGMTGVSL